MADTRSVSPLIVPPRWYPGRMKPSEVINNGIAAIEQHGWCQGDFTNEDGEVCARGGLILGIGGTFFRGADQYYRYELSNGGLPVEEKITSLSTALDLLDDLAVRRGFHSGGDGNYASPLVTLNDDPDTTKEDIVVLMKEGAKELEDQGQ